MNTNHRRPGRLQTAASALLATVLILPVLSLSGCGGGGGGGQESSGPGNSGVVQVQSVTPSVGTFIGGTALTIRGVKFLTPNQTPNEVRIGGNLCTQVVTVDDTTILCTSPAGTPGAVVDVEVTNELGTGRLLGGYRYLVPLPPTSDVNGDGIGDLVVGAAGDDTVALNAGAVYIVFGSRNPAELIDATTAAADVKIFGAHQGDAFGSSICTGDIDHDGIDDICVGAPGSDGLNAPDAGAVYVFYGPFASGTTLTAAAADLKLSGESTIAGDQFGAHVELADLDGDQQLEVLSSATRHDVPANGNQAVMTDAGCVYVFQGGPSLVNLGAQDASASIRGSQQNQRLGDSISCGDLDGDEAPELALGAMGGDPLLPPILQTRGRVYILPSGPGLSNGMSVVASQIILDGEEVDDQFGATSAIGDVDGDGVPDLVVGAPVNDYYGADFGRVYVFRGGPGLASGNASGAAVRISGLYSHNSLGTALLVGDSDGDFIDDLVLGAPAATNLNLGDGRAYVMRGRPGLSDLVATDALDTYSGEPNLADGFGRSLSLVDINGDGLADLVSASTYNNGGSGRVYVFYWTGTHGEHAAAQADMRLSGSALQQGLGSSIAEGR